MRSSGCAIALGRNVERVTRNCCLHMLFFGHAWLAGTAYSGWQSHCKARSNSINYNTFPAVLEMSWVPASASPCWQKVSWPSRWELPFLVVSARSPIGDPDRDIPIDSTLPFFVPFHTSHVLSARRLPLHQRNMLHLRKNSSFQRHITWRTTKERRSTCIN